MTACITMARLMWGKARVSGRVLSWSTYPIPVVARLGGAAQALGGRQVKRDR